MPTRNVNLTEELDRFVLKKVKSGRYENASEVVRAALRTLERDEREELCAKIADEGRCVFVGAVGHTALFYRQHPEPAERRVAVPE